MNDAIDTTALEAGIRREALRPITSFIIDKDADVIEINGSVRGLTINGTVENLVVNGKVVSLHLATL